MLALQSDPVGIAFAFDLPDEWQPSSIPNFPVDLGGITFSKNLLVVSSLASDDFSLPDPSVFPECDPDLYNPPELLNWQYARIVQVYFSRLAVNCLDVLIVS